MSTLKHPLKVCHIISGDRWAGAEVQALYLLLELRAQCQLKVLIMNSGELKNKLERAGIDTVFIDETTLSSWQIFKQIRRSLVIFQPDIVHTHREKENVLGTVANLLATRARSVRTTHGAPEFKPRGIQKIQALMDDCCGKLLQHAIISVSDELRHFLADKFGDKKVVTILNGINPDLVVGEQASAAFKRDGKKQHIGLIGRIEPVKRVDLFLGMAALLTNAMTQDVHFHVFGDGSQLDDMKILAQELDIETKVSFHGHINNIADNICALDVIVMPSDHEGLPMTILEALALSTPVVAHRVGGLTKLLDQPGGYLCATHTLEEYFKLVRQALGNLDLKPQLPPQYTAAANALSVMNLYENLINS